MTKKLIGTYQLITGILGAIIIIANVFSGGAPSYPSPLYTQLVVGVILFGLIGWAGYGLLNKGKNAVKISRLLQALQIISFTIGGTMYKFTAGAFIALGIKNGDFTYGIGAQVVDFAITPVPGDDFTIVIYIVPIILLWGLTRIKG